MSKFDFDLELNSGSSTELSVDGILAEFQSAGPGTAFSFSADSSGASDPDPDDRFSFREYGRADSSGGSDPFPDSSFSFGETGGADSSGGSELFPDGSFSFGEYGGADRADPKENAADSFTAGFSDLYFDTHTPLPDYDGDGSLPDAEDYYEAEEAEGFYDEYDGYNDLPEPDGFWDEVAVDPADDGRFYDEMPDPVPTDTESVPDKPKKKSLVSSMRDEARRLVAQMQAQKVSGYEPEEDEEEEAPLYGDLPEEFSANSRRKAEYDYDPDDGYEDAEDTEAAYTPAEPEALDIDALISEYDEFADLPSDEELFPAGQDDEDIGGASEAEDYGGEDDYDLTEDDEYGQEPAYDADPTDHSDSYGFRKYTGSGEEPEIDSRFNLGGKIRYGTVTYNDHSVALDADRDYVQPQQSGYNPSQWTPDYDDPLAESNDEDQPQRKKHKFRFGRKKAASKSSVEDAFDDIPLTDAEGGTGFRDDDAGRAEYAENGSYESGGKFTADDAYFPPTFREYVLSIFASLFLRIRGSVTGSSNQTMSDTEEDLGPELTPADAAKYYGSFIKSMRLRLRISAVLLAILCYVTLGLPVPNMLKYIPVASAFCFALQSAIMLLALDVVTTGVMNAFRLRIGADSLAVLACLFTGADALIVALSDSAAIHIPLCAISSLSVVGLLLAAFLNTRGLRKAMRVPAIGKRFYTVTAELSEKSGELSLLKSMKSIRGFVHRTEEAGPDENLYVKIGPFVIAFSLLLTIIVAAAKKSFSDFLFIFSAILTPAVPFASMLAFALPFFLGSSRIFRSGAAIAGWSGLCDIGASKSLIITDRDLFPESSITMESVRIFADEDAQKVISYAGTMMSAAGCSSAACFLDLMDENGCGMKQVDGFEYLPGGGMKGIIEGHVVLCGSTDLMRLMNVRIPFRLTDKTNVLLAIDGILYGIFSLHYEPLPQVRQALVALMRSNRHPVFAMADFNINPEMLHNLFDIATDGYDFPPYVERFDLLKPAGESKGGRISGVICNEGLGPLTHLADAGRSMYLAIRANVLINAAATAAGVVTVFLKLLIRSSIAPGALLAIMLLWTLPVILVSIFAGARK